jgi:hypothetical protein
LAETLTSIATELEQLMPKRDLEAEAAVARIFRGWSEPEMRRRHRIRRSLRNNRLRFNNRGGDMAA